MAAANPTDIANVCKLLERLRTGEMNLIPGIASLSERKADASTEMLQRVETVLSGHLRRMQEPLGDGGPAFPFASLSQNQATGETSIHQGDGGMTLRDYFAAKALGGILACMKDNDFEEETQRRNDYDGYCRSFAESAYSLADAMLKARSA